MAPHADHCEETDRLNPEEPELVPTHQGRRILPQTPHPAQAWIENEDHASDSRINSPGESRRLLAPSQAPFSKSKCKLQAGLTLGVWGVSKDSKHALPPKVRDAEKKTKFQKRREKLIAVFRPPYFILSVIFIMLSIHLWGSDDVRAALEWVPGEWQHQPWRLLTYGLVHAGGASHLALNALIGLFVAWRLELEQSWWRVLCVWCGGLVAGALGAGALQTHTRMVGASAAVYSLLFAHVPNVCLRRGFIPLWWFRPLSVVVLSASELIWSLLPKETQLEQSASAHVAWSAHALGAAVGVPLAFIVFTGENTSKMYVKVLRVISAGALVTMCTLAIIYYSCWYEQDLQSLHLRRTR